MTGLALEVDLPPSDPTWDRRANQVYRIVQDALYNVSKHAAASEVRLTVEPVRSASWCGWKTMGWGCASPTT